MDTRDSNWFLDTLLAQRPGFKLDRVADCGAGIGRVAKNLLLPRCGVVDLVEQSPRLLNAAPAYLSGSSVTQFVAAPGESVNDVLQRIGTPQAAALVNRVGLLNVGLQVNISLFLSFVIFTTSRYVTNLSNSALTPHIRNSTHT